MSVFWWIGLNFPLSGWDGEVATSYMTGHVKVGTVCASVFILLVLVVSGEVLGYCLPHFIEGSRYPWGYCIVVSSACLSIGMLRSLNVDCISGLSQIPFVCLVASLLSGNGFMGVLYVCLGKLV